MSSSSSIESILEREGFYLFTGNGTSMLPLIRPGIDTVEVRPILAPLKRGDVILYRSGDKYVLHRIIKADANGTLHTRGDNCIEIETVRLDKVIGLMTKLWRGERLVRMNMPKYRSYTLLSLGFMPLFRKFGQLFWQR